MSIAAGLGSSDRSGDKRPALLVLFIILATVPVGGQLFGFRLLPQLTDLDVVGLAILAWVVMTHHFWWVASRWERWLGDRNLA